MSHWSAHRSRFTVRAVFLLAALLGLSASALPNPPGSRWIDVTAAPYHADPTGQRDSTAAIQKAIADAQARRAEADERDSNLKTALFYEKDITPFIRAPLSENQTLYFPAGTYLLTDTLSLGEDPYRARKTQFVGEGRESTVLKLADHAAGFGDVDKPKAVLAMFTGEGQKNWSDGTNIAMNNVVEDLTIDVGAGNAGAVGLDYINNNAGYIRHVTIRSSDPDGRGAIGLDLTRSLGGIGLITQVLIEGFDRGVVTGGGKICYTFEHVELRNQREVGIDNQNKLIQLRGLRSQNRVPAIINHSEIGQLVLLESELLGGADDAVAIDNRGGSMLLRNVTTSGYAAAVREHGQTVPGASIDEYVYPAVNTLFEGTPKTTLNLPIEETPTVPVDPVDAWAIVDGQKQVDDTQAIQDAIDSGASTVFLLRDAYQVDGTIHVRGNVRRLNMDLSSFYRSRRGIDAPLFRIETGAHPVTVIEGIDSHLVAGDFMPLFFLNASGKTVLIRDVYFGQRGVQPYRNTGRGDLFLECAAGGGGTWVFRDQKVWARFLNPERADPFIINDGGDLWVFGFKFEAGQPGFVGINGSRTEALGGLFNIMGGPDLGAYIINDHSDMSITGAQDRSRPGLVVREFREGEERRLGFDEVWTPRRNGTEMNLALYRGNARTAPGEQVVRVEAVDALGSEDGDPVSFRVTRSGQEPLAVRLAPSPFSEAGWDQLRDADHTVKLDNSEATVSFVPRNDDQAESPITLQLMPVGGDGYGVDPENWVSGRVLIQDDDLQLDDGLLAHYDFAGPTVRDTSGQGNDPNDPVKTSRVDGRPALLLDDEVRLGVSLGGVPYHLHSGELGRGFVNKGFSNKTVAFDVKVPKNAKGKTMFFKEGGDAGWGLWVEGDQLIAFASNNRDDRVDLQAPYPTDGQWHHVALVYVRGQVLLYRDGAMVDLARLEDTSVDMHKAAGQLGPAKGAAMANFLMYDRALNQAEIRALAGGAEVRPAATEAAAPTPAAADDATSSGAMLDESFDQMPAGKPPKGWWFRNQEPGVTVEKEGDDGCARLANSTEDASVGMFHRFALPAAVTSLRVAGRYRTVDLTPGDKKWQGARVLIRFEPTGQKGKGPTEVAVLARESTGDWQEFATTLDVPEGTESIRVEVLLDNSTGVFDLTEIAVAPGS